MPFLQEIRRWQGGQIYHNVSKLLYFLLEVKWEPESRSWFRIYHKYISNPIFQIRPIFVRKISGKGQFTYLTSLMGGLKTSNVMLQDIV